MKPAAGRRGSARRGVPRESVDAILAFADLARREHLRWYLFGAQAVAAYGVPRTTGDVDITLDLGDRGLETLVAPLRRAGFLPTITDESFAAETRIYPVTHRATNWNFDLVLDAAEYVALCATRDRHAPSSKHTLPVGSRTGSWDASLKTRGLRQARDPARRATQPNRNSSVRSDEEQALQEG